MRNYLLLLIGLISSNIILAQCVDNGNYWNQSWVSCTTSSNPNPIRGNDSHWLLYEFTESQYIDSSYVWNANRVGESGWGAKDVVVDYSLDGSTWQELGEYTFPQAPETSSYEGFLGPNFGGLFLNKILVTVLSTHDNGSCASLAEVQFRIDRSACYGVIDACGLCNGPGEISWYLDADNDGFGDLNTSISNCSPPAGYVADYSDLCDNGHLGWSDIDVLFANNGCSSSCHGGGASGGLDLRSFSSTALGGNSCGTSLLTGTTLVDIITQSGYADCGDPIPFPSMNDRTGGQLDAQELAKIQAWIDGGAPEICTEYICPDGQVEIPYNGIDDDCNPATLDDDLDQDGLLSSIDCDDSIPDAIFQIKAFLQGAFNPTTNLMANQLTALLSANQPFSRAPWNYNGSEQLSNLPNGMVDWVLVELRSTTNEELVIAQKAAVLLKDGSVTDNNVNYSGVLFDCIDANEPYFVAIRSRNHIAVLSDSPVLAANNTILDFTSPLFVRGGEVQLASLDNGNYGLIAGDQNSDGVITVSDFNAYSSDSAAINVYFDSDFNLDGNVTVSDFNIYLPNSSKIGVSAIRY